MQPDRASECSGPLAGETIPDTSRTSPAARHTRLLVHSIPIVLFLIQRAACLWAGIGMEIPLPFYQLLDQQELATHPLWSLFFLHSQPPMLNGLLAIILRGSAVTGLPPEALANVVFASLGAAVAWGTFRLTWLLTGRIGWAALATVLVLADPGTHTFQHQYFYPLMLQAGLIGVALCAFRYLSDGRARYLSAVVILAVAICNTSSLYHLVWALGLLSLLLWLQKSRDPRRWVAPVAVLVLLAGVSAWPLKNLAVFGQFTQSTWEGLNLSRVTKGLEQGITGPEWQRKTAEDLAALHERYPTAPMTVLVATAKSDGSVNMNQYRLAILNKPLKNRTIRWLERHPLDRLRMATGQYWMWTRASYADCYLDGLYVPPNAAYRVYARLHQAIFYPDLRPTLEQFWPGVDAVVVSHITHQPVSLTLFGVVFPVILAGVLVLGWREFVHGGRPSGGACLVMLYCVFWVLMVPCLTDGHEGNRMRFAVDPLITVLAVNLAHRLMLRRAARRPLPAIETAPEEQTPEQAASGTRR